MLSEGVGRWGSRARDEENLMMDSSAKGLECLVGWQFMSRSRCSADECCGPNYVGKVRRLARIVWCLELGLDKALFYKGQCSSQSYNNERADWRRRPS